MKIAFSEISTPSTGVIAVGVTDDRTLGATARALDEQSGGMLSRALGSGRFSGKKGTSSTIVAPHGLDVDAVILMGLGQPQHGRQDLKGTSTNLVQQNTHVVIPFVISSRGYGFLWNNPAVGRVEFATNISRWRADATPGLDYWITEGECP